MGVPPGEDEVKERWFDVSPDNDQSSFLLRFQFFKVIPIK
jgi:hypothetical protein